MFLVNGLAPAQCNCVRDVPPATHIHGHTNKYSTPHAQLGWTFLGNRRGTRMSCTTQSVRDVIGSSTHGWIFLYSQMWPKETLTWIAAVWQSRVWCCWIRAWRNSYKIHKHSVWNHEHCIINEQWNAVSLCGRERGREGFTALRALVCTDPGAWRPEFGGRWKCSGCLLAEGLAWW